MFRRRNRQNQTHVVAGATSRTGNVMIERIGILSTPVGIGLLALCMFMLRVVLWVVLGATILMVGRQSGGLISWSVAFYLWFGLKTGKDMSRNRLIPGAMAIAVGLIGLDLFGYWLVDILDWEWMDLRLYYSWWGNAFAPAPAELVAARLFSVLIVASTVWSPARLSDLALGKEIIWPKLRETVFAAADPGSVDMPPEHRVAMAQGNGMQQDRSELESAMVVIPEPEVIGH